MNKHNPRHYQEFYEWICKYAEERHGKMPTLRAIVASGFFRSTSSAQYALNILVAEGKLEAKVEYIAGGRVVYYVIVGSVFLLPNPWDDYLKKGKTK